MCMHAHLSIHYQLMRKEDMSLKESKEGGMEGLEWRKKRREDDANYNFQNKENRCKK